MSTENRLMSCVYVEMLDVDAGTPPLPTGLAVSEHVALAGSALRRLGPLSAAQ